MPDTLVNNLLDLWDKDLSNFGFIVLNSKNQSSFDFQKDKDFNIASSYKVFVLGELLRRYEMGQLSLEEQLFLSPETRIFDSTYTETISDGTSLSILELARAMIRNSDNTATELLQSKAGAANIRSFLHNEKMENTRFPESLKPLMDIFTSHDSLDQGLASRLFKGDLGIVSSPGNLAGYYHKIFSKSVFKKEETFEIFKEIMTLEDTHQGTRWPEGIKCYRKSGNIDLDHYFGFSIAGVIQKEEEAFPFALCLNFSDGNQINPMLDKFKKSFGFIREYILKET